MAMLPALVGLPFSQKVNKHGRRQTMSLGRAIRAKRTRMTQLRQRKLHDGRQTKRVTTVTVARAL